MPDFLHQCNVFDHILDRWDCVAKSREKKETELKCLRALNWIELGGAVEAAYTAAFLDHICSGHELLTSKSKQFYVSQKGTKITNLMQFIKAF